MIFCIARYISVLAFLSPRQADRITQTGNTFTLQSGISGETFNGKLTGDRIETNIPRTSPGKLSPDRNTIRFSDMAMVRLGSPTCGAIATCQLP